MNDTNQKYEDWYKNKTILVTFIITTALLLIIIGTYIYFSEIEPNQTKLKMQERINQMLSTNQTYDRIMDERNYIDGVGFVWFQYYDGRMHHGSMTFQDLNGRILPNGDRNYQYFKEIMGDPLNES